MKNKDSLCRNAFKTGERVYYIIFLLISISFLFIFSVTTSPLYSYKGGDSAIFIMLGRMFLDGRIPYVEFFDHKGPVLIFIEALGLSLYPPHDITGVLILQVISLTVTQILIYRCCRFFLSRSWSFSIVLLCLIAFGTTIEEGNLTEEYSLPFLFLSLYYTLETYFSGEYGMRRLKLFIIGLCAAILFWLRPSNMGVICACVLFLMIMMIRHKHWGGLLKLLVFVSLGFFSLSAFFVIYYMWLGAKTVFCSAGILFLFSMFGYFYYKTYWIPDDDRKFMIQASELISYIPRDDYNKIYGYDIPARFWTKFNLMPCYKFFTMQEAHSRHDLSVMDSINNTMLSRAPLWVIAGNQNNPVKTINKDFYRIVYHNYEMIHKTKEYSLFRKNNVTGKNIID